MDDWQDAAFANRHLHNRIGKSQRGSKQDTRASFDVRKTFGSYQVKCQAASKLQVLSSGSRNSSPKIRVDSVEPSLEIFNLTENGDGVIGELLLPGMVRPAMVLLAGSKKNLMKITSEIDGTNGEEAMRRGEDQHEERSDADENSGSNKDVSLGVSIENSQTEEDTISSGNEEDEDAAQKSRFQTFEKNSFRSPKFWLRWRGRIRVDHQNDDDGRGETNMGYIVFSGNDCRKFRGTISSEVLGWENIALSGWKTTTRSARDYSQCWHDM